MCRLKLLTNYFLYRWCNPIIKVPRHLDNCGEDVHERDEDEVVQGGGIGDFGQVLPSLEAHEGHGEHCGDAQRDPVWGGLPVEPERDPGDYHQQHAGAVHLCQQLWVLSVWSLEFVVTWITKSPMCLLRWKLTSRVEWSPGLGIETSDTEGKHDTNRLSPFISIRVHKKGKSVKENPWLIFRTSSSVRHIKQAWINIK